MTGTHRFADDADAYVEDTITSTVAADLTWDPVVMSGLVELPATWMGDVGPERVLRTTVGGQGLAGGWHQLRLVNPEGPDRDLEPVFLIAT